LNYAAAVAIRLFRQMPANNLRQVCSDSFGVATGLFNGGKGKE